MSTSPVTVPDLQQLRDRMRLLEEPTARVELAQDAAVSGLPRLRAGGSYEVTDLALAMALMAGPTSAGDWCAVVGIPDFGVEAAAGLGVDLSRTVMVPHPGEHWLEVLGALTDVLPLVLLRPAGRVSEAVAAKLSARMRRRGAALLVHAAPGAWPRCEVRLRTTLTTWSGVGPGHGRLRSRELSVQVRQGASPPRTAVVLLPGRDARPAAAAPRVDPVWTSERPPARAEQDRTPARALDRAHDRAVG